MTTATVPPAPTRPARPLSMGFLVVLLIVLLLAWALFRPHGNPNERLATHVTQAIIANDMRPVEKDFNAAVRPKIEDRGRVGRLSQELNGLGKLKAIKEDTPQGSPAGKHHFSAEFERATWVEDLTVDSDGKITAFHIHDPNANSIR